MSITLYGIHNCDTCRKARRWLDEQGINHGWHDLRKDGLDDAMVNRWLDEIGSDKLINRRGPSWRKLTDKDKDRANEGDAAVFVANPTIIKRPVLNQNGTLRVGFQADDWTTLFKR
ncbi:Spx/MgsR family RNA polymerase-binding regulatory protein [Gammaproteobacteria bacterium AB-CW1]|uniref:Spx/MgsR family RNA polymerase-binding regulatory protein n=1 Tax=Natronospira elongata TaxID=3110268 RepID=A0AAP6JD78_9GAMM|nr:Spx/MgsR family RNA polymerase-binding regulatory protein [Gammaproteobacteria bacterium AB-CW1]